MRPISRIEGLVVPLDKDDVDTDVIMPKQFLKSTERTGYAANLFDPWRYLDTGAPGQDPSTRKANPLFCLNQDRYREASVLLTRSNFGCGSSREHAPWALLEYGVTAIIGVSFGDIFRNNSLKNGLLVVQLPRSDIDELFNEENAGAPLQVAIDLPEQTIQTSRGNTYKFDFDPFRKRMLVLGMGDIDYAMTFAEKIRAHESRMQLDTPWLSSKSTQYDAVRSRS